MTEVIGSFLLLSGAVFALLAAIGVVRMPDVFTRMQSSTKASTLGMGCLLLGLVVLHPSTDFIIRGGSIVVFLMLTTPISAHVIARAAAECGVPLWEGTAVDERPAEMLGNAGASIDRDVAGGSVIDTRTEKLTET